MLHCLILSFIDPSAHTIPAAFYRTLGRDLIIEFVPTKLSRFYRIEKIYIDYSLSRLS